VSPQAVAALARAKAHLDAQRRYPQPVSLRFVRMVTAPWAFRLPWMRRFDGYATYNLILLRRPLEEVSQRLVTHELCHVWQLQHHPLRMPLTYLTSGYAANPYEAEAREASADAA
jgi:hypothetical protein